MPLLNKQWEHNLGEFAKTNPNHYLFKDSKLIEYMLSCEDCEGHTFLVFQQELVANNGENKDFCHDKMPLTGMYLRCSECGKVQTHPY